VVAQLGAGKAGFVEKGYSLCDPEQRLVAIKTSVYVHRQIRTVKEVAAGKVRAAVWGLGNRRGSRHVWVCVVGGVKGQPKELKQLTGIGGRSNCCWALLANHQRAQDSLGSGL